MGKSPYMYCHCKRRPSLLCPKTASSPFPKTQHTLAPALSAPLLAGPTAGGQEVSTPDQGDTVERRGVSVARR